MGRFRPVLWLADWSVPLEHCAATVPHRQIAGLDAVRLGSGLHAPSRRLQFCGILRHPLFPRYARSMHQPGICHPHLDAVDERGTGPEDFVLAFDERCLFDSRCFAGLRLGSRRQPRRAELEVDFPGMNISLKDLCAEKSSVSADLETDRGRVDFRLGLCYPPLPSRRSPQRQDALRVRAHGRRVESVEEPDGH